MAVGSKESIIAKENDEEAIKEQLNPSINEGIAFSTVKDRGRVSVRQPGAVEIMGDICPDKWKSGIGPN